MELIHRLPKAALVTVVALLFFGSTVGMVVAAGQEPLPETFGVAEPMVGDRWEYATEFRYSSAEEGQSDVDTDTDGYEWLPSDIVHDRDGVPRHVQPVQSVGSNVIGYIDLDVRRAIAQSYGYPVEGERGSSSSVLGVREGPFSQESRLTGNVSVIGYFDEPIPCGFLSDLQGAQLPTRDPVTIHGGCIGLDATQQETVFKASEMRTIQGVPTVGFVAEDGNNITKLWFTPNIPYPVRIEYDFSFNLAVILGEPMAEGGLAVDEDIRVQQIAEMTGFEPGSAPLGVASSSLPPPLSRVDTAPLGVTGPDDSGIDHPFPLSTAFAGAMQDLTFTGLRDWMAAHPDGVVTNAENWVTEDGDYDVQTWAFMVWEDRSENRDGGHYNVFAERRIAREGTPSEVSQQATGPQDSYSGQDGGPIAFGFGDTGDPDLIPEQAPTVASAMARFNEATGSTATTYGFDYTCSNFCWFDEEPDALMVGTEQTTQDAGDPITGGPGTIEALRHVFWMDEDGRMTMEERAQTQETTWTAGLLGKSGYAPAQQADASDVRPGPSPIWAAPPPAATASLTAVAFLVGLGYWLWPALKTLPFFGLFSRVRPDRMLENPLRAQIYEIIQAEPGIHYQEVLRRIEKGGSVLDHHLRKLASGGYVVVQKGSGFTCLFAVGVVDRKVMAAVPVLKTEGASRVLQEVMRRPGQSVTQLAERLGLAKSTVSYHTIRLRKAHLLQDGKELYPTDNAKKAIVYAA